MLRVTWQRISIKGWSVSSSFEQQLDSLSKLWTFLLQHTPETMAYLVRLLMLSAVAITAVLGDGPSHSHGKPAPSRGYQECGGRRLAATSCPSGQVCIDDPRKSGCG